MKKAIFAMLVATLMVLSVIAPSLVTKTNATSNLTSATVPGNLNTDTYTLYPYNFSTSLTIGFSQYGEMIDPNTLTGLNYGGVVDPFAPSMNLYSGSPSPPQYEWIEGWILNCTYVSGGSYANIWAMATYSDYAPGTGGIGGSWNQMVTVGSLDLSVRGGRKTSGAAMTTPITVLYNGPREYIATTTTTLYTDTTYSTPLLNVTFTFVFDKASKDVEVIKDVKRVTTSKSIGDMQIQFGDRGEWDLGTGTPPISFAHVFESEPTVYNGSWQPWYASCPSPYNGTYDVAQIISSSTPYTGFAAFWPKPITTWIGATQQEATRQVILTSIGTNTEDQIFPVSPPKGSNGLYYVTPTLTPIVYPQNTSSGAVVWQNDPMVFVNGVNKIVIHSTSFTDPADQVYWDGTNVYFPSAYTPATGADIKLVYEVQKSKDDMAVEPGSPFIIGEWAFMMNDGSGNAFQGVTEYGVTDIHNAAYSPVPSSNVLDREVTYMLNQTFNPVDLYSDVEQNTNRWVDYSLGPLYVPLHTPAVYVSDQQWDQYDVNSERVEDLNTSYVLHRVANDPMKGDLQEYTVTYATSGGLTYLTGINLPLTTHYYKITYSTFNSTGSYNWGIVGTTAATVDSAGLSMVSAAFKDKSVEYGLGGADIFAGTTSTANQMPFVMAEISTTHTEPSWSNYYYNNFGGTYATSNDQRVGLSDAWDPYMYIATIDGIVGTTVNVPVTTSHMIGIGGPLANMLSYYGNDFMDSLYAEPWFAAGSPWAGNIAAVTCWNRNSYSDTTTTGYATVSTAEDINGTTMLLLWGIQGRDTFYAAQWFQEEGIYELQQAPHGLTSIILQITYVSTPQGYKPTGFSVIECLGTVSERIWTGSLWGTPFTKGGFHDP